MTTSSFETVLVIEDESPMRRFLWEALTQSGFRVAEAATLAHAARLAVEKQPSIVLLDLGLLDGNGLDFLHQLRTLCRAPILVVSDRADETEKVQALDAGAVDFLTKPFGMNELMARIRVALRHVRELPPHGAVLRAGPIEIDQERCEVKVDGLLVHLTPTERELLAVLTRHAGRVVTHEKLLGEVWGPDALAHTHYLRVHLMSLRRKIERDPARPRWIVTQTGVGYRLCDQ